MQIELTGSEDRLGAWKFLISGQAGAGKTLLASTAADPLFLLFQQSPRIKSVANRSIPHVKITNDYDSGVMASDSLKLLLDYLYLEDHDYKTLVVDTGDELFQALKSGRTFENGGEFGIGDWGWIADAYRELVQAIIDIPMDVIVNYHVKTTTDDDQTFKELLLQGAAKDEAAGWFDVVGALDVYEVIDESGQPVTKRALMTSPTRSYPWLKDHSGALPHRYNISQDFVGDFPKILSLVTAQESVSTREVVAEIEPRPYVPTITTSGVPSPEDLDAKKKENPEPPLPEAVPAPIDTASTDDPEPSGQEGKSEEIILGEAAQAPSASDHVDSEPPVEPAETDPVTTVQEVLGGEQVFECVTCGEPVEDADLRELTQIRFRQYMCRPHFKEALKA